MRSRWTYWLDSPSISIRSLPKVRPPSHSLLHLSPDAHRNATKQTLERWRSNIQRLTHSLLRASETFFYRKSLVLERVVESKILTSFPNRPKLSKLTFFTQGEERINDIIKRIATSAWIFDSLPGISAISGFKDEVSVTALCKRLGSLPLLTLWTEPFDLSHSTLQGLVSQAKASLHSELDSLNSEEERESPKLSQSIGNRFRTLLLLALQSGDFKRMVPLFIIIRSPSAISY